MNNLYAVLQDFVQAIERLHISFAVMGGIATHLHGIPRPTHDLDLMIAADPPALAELFDALEAHDYTVPDIYRRGWVDRVGDMPLVKVRIYLQGHGIDVDLFLAESKFHAELMRRKLRGVVEGVELWVVTPEDLILLKLSANRPRDWSDIGDVLFMQGQLDMDYLHYWANDLEIGDRLDKALRDASNGHQNG